MKKSVAAAVFVLAILAVLLVPSAYSYRPGGLVPRALIRDHHGPPEGWVASLVQRENGLPRSATGLTHYRDGAHPVVGLAVPRNAAPPEALPVAHWQIKRVALRTPYNLLTAILKQEGVYSIDVDVRVRYADGDSALLRWTTWRYGLNVGPIALDGGGGPAGDIMVVAEE